METRTIFEIIGYVGSALVLISFLMSSVLKLRVINALGSVVSVFYGICVHTYPTVVMNAALLVINVYYLTKLMGAKSDKTYHSSVVEVSGGTLEFFINQHLEDIAKFFPSFALNKEAMNYARFIFMEDAIVGVMVGTKKDDSSLDVFLDYTTPSYRDFSVGKYAYREVKSEGVTHVNFLGDIPGSEAYLEKLGFVKDGNRMVLDM